MLWLNEDGLLSLLNVNRALGISGNKMMSYKKRSGKEVEEWGLICPAEPGRETITSPPTRPLLVSVASLAYGGQDGNEIQEN